MKYKTTITEISERDLIGNLRLKLIITFLLLSSLTGFSQCTDNTVRPGDGFTLQGWNPTCNGGTDGFINIAGITSSSGTSPNANRSYSARILTAVGGGLHPSYPTPFPIPAGSTFQIPNLPAGTYVVDIIDQCGNTSADKTVILGQPHLPEFNHTNSTIINRATRNGVCGDTYIIDTRFARCATGQIINFYFTNSLGATYTPVNSVYSPTRTAGSDDYNETRFFEVPFAFFAGGPITIHLNSNLCSRPESTYPIPFPPTTIQLGGAGLLTSTMQSTANPCIQGYTIARTLNYGTAPYTATIVETANPTATALDVNGNPFTFNYPANQPWFATANTFSGLQYGVDYTITYIDACGLTVTETINIPMPANAAASYSPCTGLPANSPFIDDTGVLTVSLPASQLKTFPITFTITSGPANWVSTLGETTITVPMVYPQTYTFSSPSSNNAYQLATNINISSPPSDSGFGRPKQFPAGTYNMTYTDACGRTNDFSGTIGSNCILNSTTSKVVSTCSYTNGNADITHTISPYDRDTRSLYKINADGSETLVSTLTKVLYVAPDIKFLNVPPGTYKIRYGGVTASGKIDYPGIGGVNGIPRIAGTNYIYEETVIVNPLEELTFASLAACSGSVTGTGKGGQAPYQYTLLNAAGTVVVQATQTSGTFNGLALGTTYTMQVVDGCGRTFNQQILINNLTTPTVSTVVQASCASANNSVTLTNLPSGTWTLTDSYNGTVTNGTGTSYTFNNLPAGSHTFTLSNALGCTAPATSTVTIVSFLLSGIDTDNDGLDNNCDLDDDNDGITDIIECGYCTSSSNLFENGSFELPLGLSFPTGPTAGTYWNRTVNQSTVPGWQTTATDGMIEFWRSNTAFAPYYLANEGTQMVELNANEISTLYQTFCVPSGGGVLTWSVKHRGRGDDGGTNTTTPDVAEVRIGTSLTDYTVLAVMSDTNQAWGSYSGTISIPSGNPGTYFIMFSSVSAAGGDKTIGNLLDNVQISYTQNCPDTDGDGLINSLDLDSDNDGCTDANEYYNSSTADGGDGGVYGAGAPTVDTNGQVTGASYTGTYTNAITATQVSVTTQPSNVSAAIGNTVTFTAGAAGVNTTTFTSGTPNYTIPPATNTNAALVYQWQISTNNGTTWSNISNGGQFSNATTATLTVSNVVIGQNGNLFRVVITHNNSICPINSNSAQLTVTDPCLISATNPDTDGDGISNYCDNDDDNDGVLDASECNNTYNDFVTAFGSGEAIAILPSHFGLALNQKNQNITRDLSNLYGYPANSGAVIISITNASVHPTTDAWWTKSGETPSVWNITGSMSAFIAMSHDTQYYANDSKTIHIYDGASVTPVTAPGMVNQVPVAGQWSTLESSNQKTLNNLNTSSSTNEFGNWRFVNTNFGAKSFGFSTTVSLANPTYAVNMYLECDIDMDGIPNRVDLDSDNDECSDANEYYNSTNADGNDGGVYGTGTPAVNANGQVTTASYTGTYTNATTATQLNIATQPIDITQEIGLNAVFTLDADAISTTTFATGTPNYTIPPATNVDAGLTYQWQESTDGGNTWANISNGGQYNGATTNTLTVSNITLAQDENQYQVIVSHSTNICPIISNAATLNITTSPSIAITKEGTYVDTNADGVTNVGDVINYTFAVSNTGNTILTNITVTDPNAVVTGGPLASLAVGTTDTTTFTATHTITQSDIDAGAVYNLATATGTPPNGPNVTGTSTDPTPCATCPVDPACPDCTIVELVQTPSIAITKEGTYVDTNADGVTNVGDVINYTFAVSNTGNTILTNITVTDPNAVVTGGPLASLAVGTTDTTTFTATHTITQSDIDAGAVYNLATATGTPPNGPNVTGTSTDPTPCATCPVDPACPDCTIVELVQTPSIAITKEGTYVDTNADGVTNVGDVINYTFAVSNTGNTILTNITVTDPNAVVTGGPLASLAVGTTDTTTFTATHTITQSDIDAGAVYNLATATGTPPNGPNVTGTSTDPTPCATCPVDPACPDCTIVELVQTPSIAITKEGTYVDTNADGVTNVGDVINYTFAVSNTGNTILTNITVTDPNAVVTGGPLASLAVGTTDTTTFTATHTITQSDIDAGAVYNLATATGTPPNGPNVTGTSTDPTPCATCPVNPACPDCTIVELVQTPSIAITKEGTYVDTNADGVTNVGDVINYTFAVSNTGNTILTNITVTDPNAVVTGGPLASLAVGTTDTTTFTATHTITQSDIDAGAVYNLATATGTPPNGPNVTGTSTDPTPCATCPVDPACPDCTIVELVQTPSIAITKEGTYVDTNADGVTNVGDVINYTFAVSNTGNTILTNITVTDPNAVVTGGPLASLAVGTTDTTTFTATHTITQSDIDAGAVYNLATATGTPPNGPNVTGTSTDPTPCATCPVDPACPDCTIVELVQTPSIAITKEGTYVDTNADGVTNVGDVINYTFAVSNTGNTILTNITVTDPNAVVTGGPLASLAVGTTDTTTFTATHTITQSDIDAGAVYNLATATGTPPNGPNVTGTSTDPTPCATCPVDPACPDCTIVSLIIAIVDVYPTQTPGTTTPTTIGNVTTNDTLNGVPVTTDNTDVTPVTAGPLSIDATGVLTLAPNTPSGTYPITYTICEVNPVTGLAVSPANCASVTDTVTVLNPIAAIVDVFPTQTPGTTAPTTIGNVTTNDTLNGVPVTPENTDVTPVTAGPLSIDATGVLTLAPNTPSGTYPITYTICEVNPVTGLAVSPANCASITDTVTVLNPIAAIVDVYPTQTPGTTAPTTIGNVTTNDTLNGVPVTPENTDVTPVIAGPLSIDAAGVLTLAPNTPSGTYPITYTICEVNPETGLAVSPANCASVTDTVTVLNPIAAIVDVYPTQTPGTTAPTTIGNVTTNDTLNGVPVTTDNTDVTPVTTGPLSIDVTGVLTLAPNTPSGTYPITYTICEVNPVTGLAVSPANCASVTDTVTVLNPIAAIVDVFPTQTPGTTTPTTIGNVTTNDTLNGVPVTTDNTDVTPVTEGPLSIDATGVLTLAPNTPSGTYPITYTICEVNPVTGLAVSPANCASVTDTVTVLNPIAAIVDVFPTQTPGTTAPTTIGNVTTNDTLNGVPVTPENTDVTPVIAGPLSIDATGVLTLAPNTPSGTYPITYTICEVNPVTGLAVSPANCASVTDTVTVLNPIAAIVDVFPTQTPGTTTPTTIGNVTTNDTLNGVPVTTDNTDVTPVTAGPLSIDATGVLTLAPNTPSGTYPITYTICEVNPVTGLAVSPANCASVTDTVTVLNPIAAIVDVYPTQTPGTTTPTTIGNVTTNDTLNGVPVTPENTDVTPVIAGPLSIDATGVLTLAPNTPSGTYPITYTICEVNPVTGLAVSPANCASVTDTVTVLNPIAAIVDVFPTQTPGTTAPTTIGNVTTNDTLNGVPVTPENTDVTPVIAGPLSIDATGVLTLAPNTPSGTYPITYTICEVNPVTGLAVSPANCASVTDTVTVLNPIAAIVDVYPTQTPGTTTPTTIGNVTTNDTLNGVPVTTDNTDVTPVTAGPLSIDATGVLTLAPNTPSGTYPITYTICEVNPITGLAVSPANCASVTDTVTVLNPIAAIVDVFPTQTPGTTTPTTIGNVTTNDTLNGVPVTTDNTDVTPVTAGPLSIDATGVLTLAPNTPSGTYPITYTICEVNPVTGLAVSPANCASVTDTVTVLNPIAAIVDVFPTQTPGTTTPTTIGNVTTNDTLNGVPVTTDNTDVTPVTAGPLSIDATGVLTLAPNTPSGTYPITYTICEVNPTTELAVSPANCASVTDTVTVLNPIDAKDDGTAISPFATIQSAASATIVGDVTKNDTLNGVPVTGNNTDVTPVTEGPLSIDATGVLSLAPNTPSGNYTINYQLCEVDAVPGNCDTATAYVRVVLIDAANDTGNPITGITGGQSLSNVLTNDTLNGIPATLATVNLTQVSTTNTGVTLNPVNGSVNVAAGTAGGNYLVTYQICDKANPTFCDTATVSVFVEGPSIAIVKTAHFNDEHADGYAVIGETISYSFTITNTGNVPLTNVRITDLLPGIVITGEPITLGIGESDSTTFTATYPLTKEDLLLGSVTNQATAFGTSPLNYVVEDLSDSSSVLTDDSTVLGVTGCTIEVFNAISPNDDGNNDVFYIRGLECYPDNTVEIYNRWGVLVFERSGYNNTDRAFRGISEGRVTIKQSEGLPTGTYFYILKYRDSESKGHEKSGYLYLNRK